MASTFESRLFNDIRDIPLSAIGASSPIRLHPMDHSLVRDGWAHKSNIWQTSPRTLDFAERDQNMSILQKKNNKLSVTETSKTVARASTNGDHNINGTNNGRVVVSPINILPNRTIAETSSPSRQRNKVGSATDASAATTSSAHMSLFPGSAPEIESLNTSSLFLGPKRSPIGSGLQQFNVEEAEDFVPSNLRTYSQVAPRIHQLEGSMIPTDHTAGLISSKGVYNDKNLPVLSHRVHEGPTGHPHQMINSFDRENRTDVSERIDWAMPTPTSGSMDDSAVTRHTARHSTYWDAKELNRFGDTGITAVKSSNLRPDVAAYQPANAYPINQNRLLNQQHANRYFHNARTGLSTATESDLRQAINHHPNYTNSHAFSINSAYRSSESWHNGNARYQDELASINPELRDVSFGQDISVNESRSAVNNHYISDCSNFRLPTGNGRMQSMVPPQSMSYNNPQYKYLNDISRTGASRPNTYNESGGSAFIGASNESYPQDSEQNGSPRSVFLEEFRLYHKVRKYELKDIRGFVVEFSGDQAGSRFIQTKLEQANSDEKEMIFAELQTDARQLMSDVFGNYVIQKMFDHGSQAQKKALANLMQGNVLRLSLHPYGCRSVQRALEHILTDQQGTLIKELDGHVMSVVESQHGNHVIQKAIECIPGEHTQFIVDAHRNQIVRLSKHTYGCRIIQRMLEHCSPYAKRSILDELHPAIPSLIDDQFGNYVIQCIIKKGDETDRNRVIGFVQQRLLDYSMHKFASNVVEKAIMFAEPAQRAEMVESLTATRGSCGTHPPVLALLQDQYGNYVLQTVLRTVEPSRKLSLANLIRHYLNHVPKGNRHRQIGVMQDTVNAILAGHSPSSITTGPHTPRTPISLNAASVAEMPMIRPMEEIPADYTTRETPRIPFAVKPMYN